jgi:hypothetical protein
MKLKTAGKIARIVELKLLHMFFAPVAMVAQTVELKFLHKSASPLLAITTSRL